MTQTGPSPGFLQLGSELIKKQSYSKILVTSVDGSSCRMLMV